MAKASSVQLMELGHRIQRGQIPTWKISAVFGIVETDSFGMYLRLTDKAKRQIISAEQVQALIEGKDETLGIFKVTVDYGQTLEQMIAAGRYGLVDGGINKRRFPVKGEGKVERELVLTLLQPNDWILTNEVLSEIDRRGLRSAVIEDLLALGASHPELEEGLRIVELGSSVYEGCGRDEVVMLQQPDGIGGRNLGLISSSLGWTVGLYRFLAVRKDAA